MQSSRRVPRALTYVTVGILIGTGVAYLAYTAATIGYLIAFRRGETAGVTVGLTAQTDGLATAENIYFIALALAGLATLATAGIFIAWSYQAYRAAASSGATENTWSPGWAIGAWFIPLANLVMPRLVLGEMERMSHPAAGPPPIGDRWRGSPTDSIGRVWWVIFVGAYVLSTIAFTTQSITLDNSIFEMGVIVEIVSGLLYVIAAGLGAVYVLRIGRRLGARTAVARPAAAVDPVATGFD